MTILISIEDNFSARYLLRTGIVNRVLQVGIPVVIAMPRPPEEAFKQLMEAAGVKFIPQPPHPRKQYGYFMKQVMHVLEFFRTYGIPHLPPKSSLENKYKDFLLQKSVSRSKKIIIRIGVSLHKNHRWFRRFSTTISHLLLNRRTQNHRRIIKDQQISLILLDGISGPGPQQVVWASASQGLCRCISITTNWDHTTTKGYRGVLVDHYLVWGPEMENDLVTNLEIPKSRIQQVGSPLFDPYFQSDVLQTRQEICSQFGLNPEKPVVLFVSTHPRRFPHNHEVARFLMDKISTMPMQPQLLVRLHPKFSEPYAVKELEEHKKLAKEQGIAHSIPDVPSQKVATDMSYEDMVIAASLIQACDVVVNIYSTMQLDACICDKPVINIGFAWTPEDEVSYNPSLFGDFAHLQSIAASGAIMVAHDRDELSRMISESLQDPSVGRYYRKQIVESLCGVVDGHAADRIIQAIEQQYRISLSYIWCKEGSL